MASQQEALVRALLTGAPPPPGFDPAALEAAGDQLRRKRRRLVARSLPALAAWLGDRLGPSFAAHARAHPSVPASPLRDGLAFAAGLDLTSAPAAVHRERAQARVRLARWPGAMKQAAHRWAAWRYRD